MTNPDPPIPWAGVDPWAFSEGGYSRDEFMRYRALCRRLYTDSVNSGSDPVWTLDDGTVMTLHEVNAWVNWTGARPEPPGEAAARAKAASTGLGYLYVSRGFRVAVGWTV